MHDNTKHTDTFFIKLLTTYSFCNAFVKCYNCYKYCSAGINQSNQGKNESGKSIIWSTNVSHCIDEIALMKVETRINIFAFALNIRSNETRESLLARFILRAIAHDLITTNLQDYWPFTNVHCLEAENNLFKALAYIFNNTKSFMIKY